jgi:glycine/D-amino acid oxidase-like deaminating enzyme
MRKVKFVSVLVLLALLLGIGLGVGTAQEPPPSSTSETLDPQTQEYVLDLVRRWAYKETYDEADSEKVREGVRALSVEEARLLLYLNSAIGNLFYPYGGPIEPVVETSRQNYLLDLARRALYEGTSESVGDEIEALSGDERQLYTNLVTATQEIVSGRGASYLASHLPDHRMMNVKAAEEVMEATGKNWLDMSQAELEDVLLNLIRQGKFEPQDFAAAKPGFNVSRKGWTPPSFSVILNNHGGTVLEEQVL